MATAKWKSSTDNSQTLDGIVGSYRLAISDLARLTNMLTNISSGSGLTTSKGMSKVELRREMKRPMTPVELSPRSARHDTADSNRKAPSGMPPTVAPMRYQSGVIPGLDDYGLDDLRDIGALFKREQSIEFSSERVDSSRESSGSGQQGVKRLPDFASQEDRLQRISAMCVGEFVMKEGWSWTDSDNGKMDLAAKSAENSRKLAFAKTKSGFFDQSQSYTSRSISSDLSLYSGFSVTSAVMKLLIASPASPSRIIWELLGILFIIYDMIYIPVVIFFTVPEAGFTAYLEWVARIFWTLNVPIVLTTGIISNGVVVLKTRAIFLHYLRTWFAVDVITVIPDWLFLILNAIESERDGDDASSVVRLLRLLKLLRLARLMRMAKLRDAWYKIYDTIDSERLGITLAISKNILILMMVNHYIACFWFAVGLAQTGDSWLRAPRLSDDEATWEVQFLAAYHWSLTQFASSVDLYPRTPSERTFAIAIVIFGMVGFSYLVGSIASSLARLRSLNERKTSNFWMLRKFLKQNNVPHELCVRIRCYVESQWERMETHLSTRNVESLNMLSDALKSDLACALNAPALSVHPLFFELQQHLHSTIRRVILGGISELSLAPEDLVFSAGEHATHMSVIVNGSVVYARLQGATSYEDLVATHQDWVAEPVLWVQGWVHLGDLTAQTACDFLQVDHSQFLQLGRMNPLAFMMLSSYSREYTRWLNGFPKELLSDISQGDSIRKALGDIIESIADIVPFRNLSPPKKVSQRVFGMMNGLSSR